MSNLRDQTRKSFKQVYALSPLALASDPDHPGRRSHLLYEMHETFSRSVHYQGKNIDAEVRSGFITNKAYWGGIAVVLDVSASSPISPEDVSMMLHGQDGAEYVVYDERSGKFYHEGKEWEKPEAAKPRGPSPK